MPVQGGLFGPLEPDEPVVPRVLPAAQPDDLCALATRLPTRLRLGTSSWNFPGWRGLVYAPSAPQKHLSRHGLEAYGRHPLFRAVGLDRAFYAPLSTAEHAEHAAVVPPEFRFLVKAWGEITSPGVPGKSARNPRYLDAAQAVDLVLAPAVEGLADRLGPLVFQFPPQGAAICRRPEAFADRLHAFLAALPTGANVCVELRDEALLTQRYAEALLATGTAHVFCIHPRMPSLERQREVVGLSAGGGGVTVRWMLHAGLGYEAAKEKYDPFDRLVDPDPTSRAAVSALVVDALATVQDVTVVANNKAEGSAPLTVIELARLLTSIPGVAG